MQVSHPFRKLGQKGISLKDKTNLNFVLNGENLDADKENKDRHTVDSST